MTLKIAATKIFGYNNKVPILGATEEVIENILLVVLCCAGIAQRVVPRVREGMPTVRRFYGTLYSRMCST